jgi:hypothetical protein
METIKTEKQYLRELKENLLHHLANAILEPNIEQSIKRGDRLVGFIQHMDIENTGVK